LEAFSLSVHVLQNAVQISAELRIITLSLSVTHTHTKVKYTDLCTIKNSW